MIVVCKGVRVCVCMRGGMYGMCVCGVHVCVVCMCVWYACVCVVCVYLFGKSSC